MVLCDRLHVLCSNIISLFLSYYYLVCKLGAYVTANKMTLNIISVQKKQQKETAADK